MFFDKPDVVGPVDVQNVEPAAKTTRQKQGSFVQFVLNEMMALSPDTPPPPPCFLILTGGKSKPIFFLLDEAPPPPSTSKCFIRVHPSPSRCCLYLAL